MWKLVIEDDEGKRTVVPLSRDDYTIGRQEGNTIRLTERNVSRVHGRVRRKRAGTNGSARDTFALEDCQSYNGVFVNGLRVASSQDLQHGDLIQIGDYRIVLQDDAAASAEVAAVAVPPEAVPHHDVKSTVPMASAYRGSLLTERPNRLVMLVGPTPGVEYPLDRERMTIGRADDASISVNHNSVSRLHCEVHALGDGRFEIVDKGSSNGVRVNAVELRRSIIEAGDTIELGDVRFKFVGAGQVFVPGPNESQQLTAISDREAELAAPTRRGLAGYAVPILGAGVVGAGIILAFVYVLRARAATDAGTGPVAGPTPPADAEQALVLEAKARCTIEDCEEGHRAVSGLPAGSMWRSSPDFRQIEGTWATSLIKRAEAEPDIEQRRKLLTRVFQTQTVDAVQRQQAADLLSALDRTPTNAPPPTTQAVVVAPPPVPEPRPTPPTPTRKPEPTSHPTLTSGTASPPTTVAPQTPKPPPVEKKPAIERAAQAIFDGKPWEARQILEAKGVRTGHGTQEEVTMLKKLCSAPPDPACLEDIRRNYGR